MGVMGVLGDDKIMPLQFPDMTLALKGGSGVSNFATQYKNFYAIGAENRKRKELDRAYNVLSGGEDIDDRNYLQKVSDKNKGIEYQPMDQKEAMNTLLELKPKVYDRIIKQQEELKERKDSLGQDTLKIAKKMQEMPEQERMQYAPSIIEGLKEKYPEFADEINIDLNQDGVLSDDEISQTIATLSAYEEEEKISKTKQVFNINTKQYEFATEEQIEANKNLVPTKAGPDEDGSSEFERLGEKVKNGSATDVEENRYRLLGGLVERPGPQIRHTEKIQEAQYKDITSRYTTEVKNYSGMSQQIDKAVAAIDIADFKIATPILQQILSNLEQTSVRAQAELQKFSPGSIGALHQRISGAIGKFLMGEYTDTQLKLIKDGLSTLKTDFLDPAISEKKTIYRRQAVGLELDPGRAIPYESPEEVRDDSLLNKEQKMEILKKYFPEMFSGKQ